MAFHDKSAYFTGYKYEPDPQPEAPAVEARPLDELQSIVETIVREKADQAPEDQAATAEGDTTFSDLMEQHDTSGAEPEPMPSALDEVPADAADAAFEAIPVDRLMDSGEFAEGEDDSGEDEPDWIAEMGLAEGEGAVDDESDLLGEGGLSLEKALQGQPEEADRLGLDSMFGAPGQGDGMPAVDDEEVDGALADMFGGEPGYEDLVGEAIGIGDDEPESPQTYEDVADLLPEEEEDIAGPDEREYGDRGFLKSILMAEERAASAAQRVLSASDVMININIGETEGEPADFDEPDEMDFDELGDEGESDELGSDELGSDELGNEGESDLDLGGESDLDLGGESDELGGEPDEPGTDELDLEAADAVRRLFASGVTININIGEGGEVDVQAPDELDVDEEPDLGEEPEPDLGEDLGEEPDLGEAAPAKKGDGETFDELDDIGDVFDMGVGDENDEIEQFGI